MVSLLQPKVFLDGIYQRVRDFLRAMERKYRAIAVEFNMEMATFAGRKFCPLFFQPPLELAVLHGADSILLTVRIINT
jgi:hypothetical protein